MSVRSLARTSIQQDEIRRMRFGGPKFAYATVSNTPAGTYTLDEIDYAFWQFNSNGSLNVTEPGLLDLMIIGGGGGGARSGSSRQSGGAGGVRYGIFHLDEGSHSVTIGGGGAGQTASSGSTSTASHGTFSTFGTVLRSGGGGRGRVRDGQGQTSDYGKGDGGSGGGTARGSVNHAGGGAGPNTNEETQNFFGINLDYTGVVINYSAGGRVTTAVRPPNLGHGGNSSGSSTQNNGSSGIVVVRARLTA